jgi:uncharacterized protein YjiS (DUF1127 family)
MSTIQTEQTSTFIDRKAGSSVLARGLSAFGKLAGLLVLWHRRASMRRDLRTVCELDDHLLKDIGLTRSEVRREAMQPFWRAGGPAAPMPCAPRVDGERRQ